MNEGRSIIGLNAQWKFSRGDAENAFYRGYDDSSWKTVTLPHDWAVEEPFAERNSSGTGYAAGGIGWYRARFTLPADCESKRILVTFDGVYNNSQVWCNGNNLGKRPYGYSSFTHDISPFCEFGARPNVIAVKVSHLDLADSRWYTGSGIYRDVRLTVTDPVHLAEHSPFVHTAESSAASAKIGIVARVVNESPASRSVVVLHEVADPEGAVVARHEDAVRIEAGETREITRELAVESPCLWSPANPSLYRVTTEVRVAGTLLDAITTTTGIRCFRFDPAKGFFLNGDNMKIKGVCVHHDAGCLGAAVPAEIWALRLRALKDMGCNAIRMSHNPPAPCLLDLCDELGFLVIDEAFDEWETAKNKWSTGHNVYPPKRFGYADDFPVWHEADLSAMILRDRNHPSIILWSVGNEVDYPNDPYCHPSFAAMVGNNDASKPAEEMRYDPDKPNAARLAQIARRLVAVAKRYDETRPVTAAVAFPELSNETGYCAALDVVGYNYKEQFYARDRERFPDRALFGSENGAGYEQWLAVKNSDAICAQFVWTGIDYLGEAKGWPVRASPAGFIDLAGVPKPKYWFRKSLWSAEPVVFLAARRPGGSECESWNWTDGERLEVVCFTNRPSVELFLNGSSLGEKKLAESETGYLSWEANFAPGTLKAVAAGDTAAGNACSSELRTAGNPAAIVANDIPLEAAAGETVRIEFSIVDSEGIRVPLADDEVSVTVDGPAELMGLENGNIADVRSYASRERNAFQGRLVAYARSTGEEGTARVKASAPGLRGASISVLYFAHGPN